MRVNARQGRCNDSLNPMEESLMRYESSVALLKMAATLALLVFGLRLLAPVPHPVGPAPLITQERGVPHTP